MMRLLAILWAAALILAGCSTATVRVMPGEGGVNRVVADDVERPSAEKAAVDAAVEYCDDRGREAIFLSEQSEYTGTMDEGTREAVRQSSAAPAAMAEALRKTESHDAAVVFDTASGVGRSVSSGKDYRAEVSFRCE